MTNTDTEPTVLDRMKEIEARKEKARTLKVLNILKVIARRRQEDKELCLLYLQEICKSEKEQKQVIDWINNLDDVQVGDDRRSELKDEVKKTLAEEKRKIEKKVNDEPEKFLGGFVGYSHSLGLNTTATVGQGWNSGALGTSGAFAVSNAVSPLNVGGVAVTNTPGGLMMLDAKG